MGYHSLILVTADYHTPRAALELRAMLPEARIIPYPVITPDLDARHWQDTSSGARLMVSEYLKYLVALGREGVFAIGPPETSIPTGSAKA
jgi:uncharacterized SAM-binding protein YcdF (DUF218 family)